MVIFNGLTVRKILRVLPKTENIGKSINKIYEMLTEDLAAGNIHENHINILKENLK